MKRIILSVFAAAVTAAWAIPASAGDVTFSGQYRLRGEYQNNYTDLDNDASDTQDFWAQRVRLTANAKATDDVSAKITIQDTRTFGANGEAGLKSDGACSRPTTIDENIVGDVNGDSVLDDAVEIGAHSVACNGIDLHEAYLNVSNIFGAPVSLRAGRQELAYGDERLIGAVNWSNNGQAFDAIKLMYTNDAVNVDLFSATIAEDSSGNNDDDYLNGIYATLKQVIPNNTLDVYLFHQTDGSDLARYTLGARVKGAVAGVDYTVEVPYQFGEADAATDISAYAFAVKAGYTLPTPLKVRVGAEYDYATGQDDSADATAFNNLYPTNHDKFGIADVEPTVIKWSNLQAWSVNASADVNEKLRLFAAYWDFSFNETDPGDSDDIGSELDLVATYKYNNNLSLEAGASRFFVGDIAGDDADDVDFAYLQITANF